VNGGGGRKAVCGAMANGRRVKCRQDHACCRGISSAFGRLEDANWRWRIKSVNTSGESRSKEGHGGG